MCFVALKTPLQTFILRYVLTYFLEILGEGRNAFPQMISLCVLMADTWPGAKIKNMVLSHNTQ